MFSILNAIVLLHIHVKCYSNLDLNPADTYPLRLTGFETFHFFDEF